MGYPSAIRELTYRTYGVHPDDRQRGQRTTRKQVIYQMKIGTLVAPSKTKII